MRLRHLFISIGFILLLFSACKSTKETTRTDDGNDTPVAARDNSALFIEANKEKTLGNLDKAEHLFQACLQLNPEDAASMYELARIYGVQDNLPEAIFYAEKAAKTDPENIWYQKLLANLYKQNSQYAEAIVVLEKLAEKYPDHWEFQHDLALTNLFIGNYQEAIAIYDRLEKKYGIAEEFSMQKQKIYLLQNDKDNAIRELEKLCEAFPTEPKYFAMIAELYLSNKQDEKALQAYEKILELDPNNPYIHISLSDYYRKRGNQEKSYEYLKLGFANPNLEIDTKVNILLAYYTVSEFYDDRKDEAFELCNILIIAHPEDPKAYSIYADVLFQDKQYEAARDALLKVVELDSTRYLVWEQLLFAEVELKNWKDIDQESKRAIALFPHQPLPYMFSAVANFQLKNFDITIDQLETGMKFVVGNDAMLGQFYSYLGDAYHETGNNEKAYEAYENALKIDPNNAIVLNNYAYYLSLENQDLEKALEMSKKAVELDPENSSNQDTYGWVFYKLNRFEEAELWINKSIQNHEEDNAEVLEHYGDVLYKLDRKEEAYHYWKRAQDAGEGGSDLLDKKVRDKKLYE
jgi:tetratricopeptide (TPR) repeat protein